MELMAYRPAPVQAAYLGYPATTGAPFIDYLIGDRVDDAAGARRALHRADRAAGGLLPAQRRRPPAAALPAARRRWACPRTPSCCAASTRPTSCRPTCWTCGRASSPARRARCCGCWPGTRTPRRTCCASSPPAASRPSACSSRAKLDLASHIARLRAADLFLDTWPCNAHTTASEALWAGVPVLTVPGQTFASRVAASLVSACGLRRPGLPQRGRLRRARHRARQRARHAARHQGPPGRQPPRAAAVRRRAAGARHGRAARRACTNATSPASRRKPSRRRRMSAHGGGSR